MADVAIQKRESLWDELQRMEDRIMRRAYEIFQDNGSTEGKALEDWLAAENELVWKPAIQLKEKDTQLEVQIAIAGMDPKDLTVEVTPDDLLVKGETKTEKKEEKGEIYTSEFRSGSLFRSVHFPKKVDPDKVKAEIRNGLLVISAPVAEASKAKKVAIQAA